MIRILLTAAGLYLAYAGLVFFLQRSLIFPRGVIPPFTDPVQPQDAEILSIHAGTETVEAWFIPADAAFPGPCPAVIFAHGNAELIDFWPEYLKPLSRNGIHLLLVEYPGYGLFPFMIRDPMDNLRVLKEFPKPALILHGKQNELIAFHHAKALVSVSRNARLIAYDCGHNDCPPDWNVFWKDVFAFLRENGMIK